MFDSKEITRRALLRAEEQRTKRKRFLDRAAMMMSTCAVAAVAVFVFMTYSPGPYQPNLVSIDDGAVPLAQIPVVETVDNINGPSFMFPGYDTVTVPAGTTEAYMFLTNPAVNSCWLSFEVILADTGETLYESSMVPPSASIEKITLARELPQGQYEAALRIKVFAYGSLLEVDEINQSFNLIVE